MARDLSFAEGGAGGAAIPVRSPGPQSPDQLISSGEAAWGRTCGGAGLQDAGQKRLPACSTHVFSRGTLAPFEPTLLCLPAIANSEFLNGPRFLVAFRALTASAGCREGAVVHLGRNPEEDVAKLRASALVRPVPNRPYQPSDPQGFPILGMGRSVNSKNLTGTQIVDFQTSDS